MGAAPGGYGDLAEALGAALGGRDGCCFGATQSLGACRDLVDGHDHSEVDGAGDHKERNDRVEEVAILDLAAMEFEDQIAEVRLADDGREQRVQDVANQRGDDGAEGRAQNDRDGQVDDVAAKNEVPESLEHVGDLLESKMSCSLILQVKAA